MTKAELSKQISDQTGIDKAVTLEVVEALMKTVKDALANGENVYLRGFGTFANKVRAEKTARNIGANTTMVIPAHSVPTFKPCKEFKDSLK